MKKILTFFILTIFLLKKNIISTNVISAINLWYKSLFPTIFPTLCLCDLLVGSNILNIFNNTLGIIFEKFFKISRSGISVFLISILCGTPSNMKIAYNYYNNGLLSLDDINKLIPLCLFFNPIFVINFTNKKIFISLIIASIIIGILFRNRKSTIITSNQLIENKYNLNESIENNMKIIINILGTVIIFMILSNLIIIKIPLISCIFAGILEVTTGLYKVNIFFKNNNIFYLFILSFGSISILIQIKGILKNININYKLLYLERLIIFIISIFICYIA